MDTDDTPLTPEQASEWESAAFFEVQHGYLPPLMQAQHVTITVVSFMLGYVGTQLAVVLLDRIWPPQRR